MIEILGKNGSGKNYLVNELEKIGFKRYVGYTTRKKRKNEIDGVDYYFVDKSNFISKIINGDFEEYKVLNDNYYGIEKYRALSKNTILIGGRIKNIDFQDNHYIPIFVDASFDTRYQRIMSRNDSIEEIFHRLHKENFAYLFDFDAVFTNNDINGLDEILSVINQDGSLKRKDKVQSNINFLKNKIKVQESIISNGTDVVNLLKFEEQLLRRLFVQGFNDKEIKIHYLKEMKKYLEVLNYKYSQIDDGYEVIDQKKQFKFKYLSKK